MTMLIHEPVGVAGEAAVGFDGGAVAIHAEVLGERRRHPRIQAALRARLGLRGEQVTDVLDAVDVSESGVLLVAAEPVGARPDDRVCLTLITRTGNLHRLGRVVRVARGVDFRTYVAIEYLDPFDTELALLLASFRRAAGSNTAMRADV